MLLCVNMDNEPASDLLALGLYRDPAFVELVRGFVPLLASPDRHRPRDRDEHNRRLPDPRFGRVLDEEHVAVEPQLFERYFHGQRVAPRHVGVAPDGTILFDLYLLQDLRAVDQALKEHGQPDAPWVDVAPLDEPGLLASPDAAARERLEARFATGDVETRARLLAYALSDERSVQQPELVRLGLRDPEPDIRQRALRAICPSAAARWVLSRGAASPRVLVEHIRIVEALEARARGAAPDELVRRAPWPIARAFTASGSDCLDVELARPATGLPRRTRSGRRGGASCSSGWPPSTCR